MICMSAICLRRPRVCGHGVSAPTKLRTYGCRSQQTINMFASALFHRIERHGQGALSNAKTASLPKAQVCMIAAQVFEARACHVPGHRAAV